MFNLLNPLEELELDTLEYGYMTDVSKFHGSSSFNIYVPKIMGAVGFGVTNSWTVPIQPKPMLINAPECMPSPASSTTMQNHINITRHLDTDFIKGHTIDAALNLRLGQTFIVNFMNRDPQEYRLERVT